jgi:hypothetical protein
MILGRVKASDRRITSGYSSWIDEISQSQNWIGLVCGLSTRNTATPWAIQ